MNCNNNYDDLMKRIEKNKEHCTNCFPIGLTGSTGAPGPTGATGPVGSAGISAACFCVEQMRNIIQQIITLYPDDNLIIAMESGNNVSGRPGSLLPAPNDNPDSGVFQLANAQGVQKKRFLYVE